MGARKSDFTLTKLDDLFSTQEQRDDEKLSKIRDIPLTEIDDFPDHPFKVRDDEDMAQLVESVKERGVITPATVRQKEDGRYEIVSGHRRKRACELTDVKKPEHALKLFIRFALAKGVITYGLELMLALFNIVQGTISTIMNSAGFGTPNQTTLPAEMITTIEDCGFFESIPLWAVTLIGGLFITVLSFIMIMTVYGRFFKLYMYTALAPIPLSTFAGEPSQNVGKSFIKSYCAVLLEGAVIVLACIIFSLFASAPPTVNPDAAAVTQVWSYIGELVFNMLVLVGAVKMSDRIIREMMGL